MALFKRAAKKEAPKKIAKKAVEVSTDAKKAAPVAVLGSHVLLSPRVTEKAAIGTEVGVYVFNITKAATKPMVGKAISDLFKVVPRKVRIVNTKAATTITRVTGRKGKTNASKKAYVYLKEGDKIDLA